MRGVLPAPVNSSNAAAAGRFIKSAPVRLFCVAARSRPDSFQPRFAAHRVSPLPASVLGHYFPLLTEAGINYELKTPHAPL